MILEFFYFFYSQNRFTRDFIANYRSQMQANGGGTFQELRPDQGGGGRGWGEAQKGMAAADVSALTETGPFGTPGEAQMSNVEWSLRARLQNAQTTR